MRIITAILLFSLWVPGILAQSNPDVAPQNKRSKREQQLMTKLYDLKSRAIEASEMVVTHSSKEQTTLLIKQAEIWKQIIALDSFNDMNWMNYYIIQRNIFLIQNKGRMSQNNKDSLTRIRQAQVTARALCLRCPPKFGEEIMDYFETGYDDATKESQLNWAEKMQPDNTLIFPERAKMAEFKGDAATRNAYCQKIKEINTPEILNYYKHLCSMAESGSILITNGDYDTYALWLAQKETGKNLYVFSLSLFENVEYRQKMLEDAGVSVSAVFDVLNPSAFIKSMVENNKGKVFYLSLTINPQYLSGVKNNLYNIGLAYRYSADVFDNITVLETNLLKHDFSHIEAKNENNLMKNYMQGFIILFRKYSAVNSSMADKIRESARQLAVKSGFWEEYKKYFGE